MKRQLRLLPFSLAFLGLLLAGCNNNPEPEKSQSSEETSSSGVSSESSVSSQESSSSDSSSEASTSSESSSSESSSEESSSEESETSSESSSEESSEESSESSSSEESSESSSTEESSEETSSSEKDYYSGINFEKTGATLKSALAERISANYHQESYNYAYEAYPYTDTDEEGKIIDVYSAYRFDPEKDHQGAPGKSNYSKEGDMFNREHTIPQSLFNENLPMKSDLHHLLPTDGYVNNRRSNYPHAYVSTVKYRSTNNTIVGTGDSSKNGGYDDDACEVPDQYKGDIARIYFYMVTRYEGKLSGWKTYAAFSRNTFPSLSEWAVKVYLEWNDLDPVSEKEIKRNNEVYKIQNNRNPFIDHPEAAHKIWDNAYA